MVQQGITNPRIAKYDYFFLVGDDEGVIGSVSGSNGDQLNPSKWPLRIRSPMGEGALRGLDSVESVARLPFVRGLCGGADAKEGPVGVAAVFGGGDGG